jgi:hypothetical protein
MIDKIINHPDIYKFNESATHEVYRYNNLLVKIYKDVVKFATIKSYADSDGMIESSCGLFFKDSIISEEEASKLFPPSF